jgi:hypothetical protein
MSVTPEMLYFQLGSLAAETPELATGPITPEQKEWIARAAALVDLTCGLAEKIQFAMAVKNLTGELRARHAETIAAIVLGALAKAELDAPTWLQGTFIVADNTFEAVAAVRRVLRTAKTDVLFADPDGDARTLTDYAVLAPYNVLVGLLAGQADHKNSLESAARRWAQRFGDARPLVVRLAAAGTIHDRLILVDRATVWALGQPFNTLTKRGRTSLVRMPPQAAARMIAGYAAAWEAAQPLQA